MRERKTAPTEGNKSEQNETISPATGLTPQQEQACILLASGESYTTVAQRLKINRGTLYKWLDYNLPFKCYYNSQRIKYRERILERVFGLFDSAISVLSKSLNSDNEAIRLKAAMWLIGRMDNHNRELQDQENDIRAVLMRRYTVFAGDLPLLNDYEYKKALKKLHMAEEPKIERL